MKSTFVVQGMHCGSCAAKVADAIRTIPGVRRADVSFSSRRADVETEYPLVLDQLDQALSSVGDYRVVAPEADSTVVESPTEHMDRAVEGTEPRESLYPLFLIIGYILGIVLLVAAGTGNWAIETMMRHFMAGFFIVFSFFKLLDLPGFVSAYRLYDIPAKSFPAWAWTYPFIEAALGVAYVLAVAPIAVNVVTFILMLVGALGVFKALADKRRIRCACLGTALNLPMTTVTLVEDLTMAAMAAAMLLMMS